MRFPQNIYRRVVADLDDELLEVRVPEDPYVYSDGPVVRIETQAQGTFGRPVIMNIEQARAAHEALGEAIFAAEQQLEAERA